MGAAPLDDDPTTLHDPRAAVSATEPDAETVVAGDEASEVVGARPGRGDHATRIGRHRVDALLGAGGMGQVYDAHDPELERAVALKVIRGAATPNARAKFLREARITGQLEHPGIVPVYELGRDATGSPYFAMRRVEGVALDALLAGAPPPLSSALQLFAKICEAVAFAHAKGIIHRDLKPANVMTGAFGEVYVMDWGLAKRIGLDPIDHPAAGTPSAHGELAAGETIDGTVMGTPAYMAPEQAAGRIQELDHRADVYGLGAILYHLLAGRAPYEGPPLEVLECVLAGPPCAPTLPSGEPVPWELGAVIAKAMSRAPDDRYPDALALRADVVAYLEGRLVGAARYSVVATLRKAVARHPGVVRAGALVLALALAALGLRTIAQRRAVLEAWDAVRAAEPRRHVADARAAASANVGEDRLRATAGRMTGHAETIAGLQGAIRAVVELRRLSPNDRDARLLHFELLLAIGTLAVARGEEAWAELAYAQAEGLGIDDALARDRVSATRGAADQRLAARRERIALRIAQAMDGALDQTDAFDSAVIELSSYVERQTVEALIPIVTDATARLVAGAQELLARPHPPDRHAQVAALAARALTPGPGLEAKLLAEYDNALEAVARALPPQLPRAGHGADILGEQQLAWLDGDGRCRTRAARLACEVIGRLGDGHGTIEPLVAAACAHAGDHGALPAGFALARLARASAPAREALRALQSRTAGGRRFARDGLFWTQVYRVLAFEGIADLGDGEANTQDAGALVARGTGRLARGELDGALADFDRAIALDGGAPARQARARALFAREAYADAEEECNRILALDPRDGSALTTRGAARAKLGRVDEALADLDLAASGAAGDPRVHYTRGALLTALGRRDEGVAAFTRAIELDPRGAANAWHDRAWLRRESGDLTGALADLDEAVRIDPREARFRANRGTLRRERGDLSGAAAEFEAALALAPRDPGHLTNRGQIRFDLGDVDGALADYDAALAENPDLAIALAKRGSVYALMEKNTLAHADFDRAIALDPADARTYSNRAGMRRDAGDHAGALADVERAVALAPDDPLMCANRGWARLATGDVNGAIRDFDRAVALAPNSAQHRAKRGHLRLELGDVQGAAADFEAALVLDLDTPDAYLGRAMVRRRSKDLAGARADLDRAITLAPRLARAYHIRGAIRLGEGDTPGASMDLERALALDPRIWGIHFALGNLHATLGRRAEALAAFRRALELAPPGSRAMVEGCIARLAPPAR